MNLGHVATPTTGDYDLSLVSTCGTRAGGSASGGLTLVQALSTDRSPATGQLVAPESLKTILLYGWTDLDFRAVDAPLCRDEVAPTSRDPVFPGVVLHSMDWMGVDPSSHLPPLTLLIGTVSNPRDGSLVTDGCGIFLGLETWDGRCYRGHWDAWGIALGGAGTFAACPRTK
jgi:hypothetical protein